ncbi:hypothetical protein, partial [Porphyromonas somerae]|uniref:hypothetical protein n=1 Tax=Porphyromonas somerae TaxID=322095 RepID=UPI00058D896B
SVKINLLELTPFYKLTHKNLSMSQLFLGQDKVPYRTGRTSRTGRMPDQIVGRGVKHFGLHPPPLVTHPIRH